MSFLFNKRIVTSKISFTEPTKTTLSQKELSDIASDGSQAIKKLKTCTSNNTVDLDTDSSTASTLSINNNNLKNVETTSSTNIADNAEDSRSEEHTSELQSRVDISYAVFCLKKK